MQKSKSFYKLVLLVLTVIFACTFFVSCEAGGGDVFDYLGTVINVRLNGGKAGRAYREIMDFIEGAENKFSTQKEGSFTYKINELSAGESIAVDEEYWYVLSAADDIYEKTDGAFNPYIYPLTELWGFSPETFSRLNGKIPSDAEIAGAIPLCKREGNFVLDKAAKTVTKLTEGAKIDLGGIVKGYIADKAKETAAAYGVTSGIVNIGGDIQLIGGSFNVGIANPRPENGGGYAEVLKLSDTAAVTSGDYERYYLVDGKRFHHILDIRTGRPADKGIISATVIGKSAMIADALSTACVVLGDAYRFDGYECRLVRA